MAAYLLSTYTYVMSRPVAVPSQRFYSANMMAGHILLKISSGFAWTVLSVGDLSAVASVILV